MQTIMLKATQQYFTKCITSHDVTIKETNHNVTVSLTSDFKYQKNTVSFQTFTLLIAFHADAIATWQHKPINTKNNQKNENTEKQAQLKHAKPSIYEKSIMCRAAAK